MSQEKVREILSHVDMTKIDLSSFKLSSKKFNELSHLYRNRVIISCFSMLIHKNEHPADEVDVAFEILAKVVENPSIYDYDTIYANERRAVDDAIDDITTRRDRNINDVKIWAIENRMKDAYKKMRKTIELAIEYGNTFEDEFDETIVERCMQIAKNSIEKGRKKTAEAHTVVVANQNTVNNQEETTIESVVQEKVPQQPTVEEHAIAEEYPQKKPEKKVSFWKRLFSKV